jgi:hypothetical protein
MSKSIRIAVFATLIFIMSLVSSLAFAGVTADKLYRAGYTCFPTGPHDWIHCLRAEKFGYPSVPVKVFDEDGIEFLGTELLLRYDIYDGQPCPQDELEEWDFLEEPPYYACHHFKTGHH